MSFLTLVPPAVRFPQHTLSVCSRRLSEPLRLTNRAEEQRHMLYIRLINRLTLLQMPALILLEMSKRTYGSVSLSLSKCVVTLTVESMC